MVLFSSKLTRITAFDLEFYVPPHDRPSERKDLRANPHRAGHLLLGGVFFDWFPLRPEAQPDPPDSYWLWQFGDSERDLVEAIYKRFRAHWDLSLRDDRQGDPIVCGIGIGRVDIAYLSAKCAKHQVASDDKIFETFNQLRLLDLETAVIGAFSGASHLVYPKTTGDMIQKFGLQTERAEGIGIWDLYDKRDFDAISDRTSREVRDMYVIYNQLKRYLWRNRLLKLARDWRFLNRLRRSVSDDADLERLDSYLDVDLETADVEMRYLRRDLKEAELLDIAQMAFNAGCLG